MPRIQSEDTDTTANHNNEKAPRKEYVRRPFACNLPTDLPTLFRYVISPNMRTDVIRKDMEKWGAEDFQAWRNGTDMVNAHLNDGGTWDELKQMLRDDTEGVVRGMVQTLNKMKADGADDAEIEVQNNKIARKRDTRDAMLAATWKGVTRVILAYIADNGIPTEDETA